MKRNSIYLLLTFLMVSCYASAQTEVYPPDIENVLQKSGKNRTQLETAIKHFKNGDPMKLRAAYFLIRNMGIHHSEDYYWTDSAGKRVSFSELDYPDWATAVAAFENQKKKYGKLTPKKYSYRDIDTITGQFLIDNIERAFSNVKYDISNEAAFSNFCEYVLPYRIANEPLQDWRKTYSEVFKLPDTKNLSTTKEVFQYLKSEYDKKFINSFSIERRTEPLPYLGALQILSRQKGLCEDIAALEVFTLRSNGLPATTDVVVNWASSSGAHTLNSTFDKDLKPIPFDILNDNFTETEKLFREPGKVIRLTYSAQKDALASKADTSAIPPGFMRQKNYVDVTKDYWRVGTVNCKLYPVPDKIDKAFICVFNYAKWRPVWWSEIRNGSANFTDMAKGSVFMPAYYLGGKIVPAGYPTVNGEHKQVELRPDPKTKQRIVIESQKNFLVYRPGKIYRLYYWDNQWKIIGKQTAQNNQAAMTFDNVPANALLLLRPEYSENKERPFTITATGERLWF